MVGVDRLWCVMVGVVAEKSVVFGILLHQYTGLEQTGGLTMIDDYGNEVLMFKNLILPAIALGSRPIGIIYHGKSASLFQSGILMQ